MKIRNILITSISTLAIGGAIVGGTIFAHTNANVNKLELLTRAVRDNTVERLQSKANGITIAAGNYNSAAIIDGALYTWGWNYYGQLGLGDWNNRNIPTQVTRTSRGEIGIATQIALGQDHSAAVIDGTLYMWGGGGAKLGLGSSDVASKNIPTWVPNQPTGAITQISLGGTHSAAIINGSLYTWGANGDGRLGFGDTNDRYIPTWVSTTADGRNISGAITQIILGGSHSAAIINGFLYIWGSNVYGQLGLGSNDTGNKSRPTLLRSTSNSSIAQWSITQVALGTDYSSMIIGGSLYTWGYNFNRQLGLGDNYDRNTPTRVSTVSNGQIGIVTQIKLRKYHSIAVIDNSLYSWGNNWNGQLGLGDSGTGTNRNIPTLVTSASDGAIIPGTIKQLAFGDYSSVAVIDGSVYAWGYNYFGQLGLGDIKDRHTPTKITTLPLIQKNTIHLNNTSVPANIRNKIVYNITIADIEKILREPNIIPNISTSLPFKNISFQSKIGTTSIGGNNIGQIVVTFENNSKTFETTINDFKPVNLTQNITIINKVLTSAGMTHFANDEINQLVADTNTTNSKLAEWIIDNNSLFIGNTTNEYTQDFPKGSKITKISDVKVVNGSTGEISFNIYVDKYYKQSGNNLVESINDTPIKITKPISLTGFKTTTKSNPSVISSSNRNLNATQLLASFGDINNAITGTGLTNLKNYIDLSSFPTNATFKIINHSLNGTSLSFQIEATGYYDDNGIIRTGSKQFDSLTIDRLEDGTSNLIQADTYDKLTPNDILKHIGYDSNNPTKPLIIANLLDYVTIEKAFPENVQFTLAQAPNISGNNTQLTLSINANTWTNVDGSTNLNPKTFGPFTYNGLSSILNTNITLKEKHNTDILAGDLIRNFGWDNVTGRFDTNAVSKYIDFSSGVKKAKYTMKNLVDNNGKVSFSIVTDRIYINGIDTQIKTTYDFEITGLKTIVDSASRSFLRENIVGNDDLNGHAISNQIIDQFSIGKEIGYYDELWNNLFDVSIYPQNTIFTINDISVEGVISKTFNIKFTASNYYQNNTTMNVAAPIRTVIVNNLKFTPTSATIKDQLPNIDPYQFFKYISYNDSNKSFDQIALQEFLNLEGFDLNNPGTATKLIDPKIEDNQVKFNLEVLNYVDQNGLLVNETKIFKIAIDANRLLSIALTDNQDQSSVDAIIGATIGGVIGFSLLVILAGLLIRRNKNKTASHTK